MTEHITLQEILELLKDIKPSRLTHYTGLVSQALTDGEYGPITRCGHSISVNSSCKGTTVYGNDRIKWKFAATVDTRMVHVYVILGNNKYRIETETKDGKYRKTADDCDTYVLYDILYELAKELPVEDYTDALVPSEAREAVVLALENLRTTLKDTRTHLVASSNGLLVVPNKVKPWSEDDDYKLVPIDLYAPVQELEMDEIGYNESLALVEEE